MNINEYRIIKDDKCKPKLDLIRQHEWNGKDFSKYSYIVNMLNSCFKMNRLNEEYVYIVAFSHNLKCIGVFNLSHGDSMYSIIGNKELYLFLLLIGADKFVVAHNHPDGNLNPSQGDINITIKIESFTKFVDIEFLEHLLIAGNNFSYIKEKAFGGF